eukprot:TRINITY_DN2026_c0_g1_i1.p1 TRINITY_DN2026_c0_g1~~TRINITY_DN2026_c0_g1_i1.p1  ORF type:complete len:116 (+),score=28.01 TRINITY_DN2026_c0_g1_i1:315-662(+)
MMRRSDGWTTSYSADIGIPAEAHRRPTPKVPTVDPTQTVGTVFPGHQVLIEGDRVSTAKSTFVAPHEQDGKALKGPSLGVWEGKEKELEEHIQRWTKSGEKTRKRLSSTDYKSNF